MDWTDRYTTPLAEVFTRGHKLALEHRVELALLKALGKLGKVPAEAYDEVKAAVDGEALCRSHSAPSGPSGSPCSGAGPPRTSARPSPRRCALAVAPCLAD